jgi:hypothetical protein
MYHRTSLTSPERTITAEVICAGRRLPFYQRPADGYPYIPGTAGASYLIAVRNLGTRRIEVLAAVDGMSLITEEEASLERSQGLVIPAHGEYRFAGFRTGDDSSRELVFGDPAGSVAEQATGSAAGCGVIGIAAWVEQHAPAWTAAAGGAAPPVSGFETRGGTRGMTPNASRGLGTHAGAERHDPVGRTSFTRAHGRPDVLVIGYKELAELEAMGITGPADPEPFPGDVKAAGYRRYAP